MPIQPVRLIVISVLALAIGALALLQSLSSVLTRQSPELAAQLFPMNGLAVEQLATRKFLANVKQESDIVPSAKRAAATARRAFANDALTPKAMAIIGFGEAEPTAKSQLLDAATTLNRRDLMLQGLVLEGRVARKDYEGTLETLDAILRVHPAQKANFFPVLMQALADDAALPALAGILDEDEVWHDEFLAAASINPAVIPNLAKLRMSRHDVNPEIDRRLIKGLVDAGEVDTARNIYLVASDKGGDQDGDPTVPSELDWGSEFPPFDWKLADEAGFRAQLAGSSTELEIFVRGGKGGAIAERVVNAPTGPFAIRVAHSLGPPEQVKDVRLQIRCPSDEEPFFDQPLRVRPHNYMINAAPPRCTSIVIIVHARAWSGRSSIRGNLSKLEIIQN